MRAPSIMGVCIIRSSGLRMTDTQKAIHRAQKYRYRDANRDLINERRRAAYKLRAMKNGD